MKNASYPHLYKKFKQAKERSYFLKILLEATENLPDSDIFTSDDSGSCIYTKSGSNLL